jgi:hypothetical protein
MNQYAVYVQHVRGGKLFRLGGFYPTKASARDALRDAKARMLDGVFTAVKLITIGD